MLEFRSHCYVPSLYVAVGSSLIKRYGYQNEHELSKQMSH